MRYKILPVFVLLYIWLAALVRESSGIVRNDRGSENAIDAVNEYLEQHKLTCGDIICDNALIKTVLSYKEAVDTAASRLGSKVANIKPVVKDNLRSVQNDIEKLIEDVKHQIYQLQLKGRLTNDKVKQILDKAHNEVLQKKIMTEYEWKNVCLNLWSIYKPSKWYKGAFRSKPVVAQTAASKLDDLMKTISQHVNPLGILTESQNNDILNLIRASIENKDYGQWTMTAWLDFLSKSIGEKLELNKETLSQVIESVKDSLIEFKLNENYSNQILPNGLEHAIYSFLNELKNSTYTIKESIFHIDSTAKNMSAWLYHILRSSRWLRYVKKDFVTLSNNIKIGLGQLEKNVVQNWPPHQHHTENECSCNSQQAKATATLILGYPDIKPSSLASTIKSEQIISTNTVSINKDTAMTTNTAKQDQGLHTESVSEHILTGYEDKVQTVYPVPVKTSEAILYSNNKLLDDVFIDPWKENEQDIYHSLGYSETHVEWIKSYLERHFRNKKSTACGDIDEAVQVIKRYLSNIKIQSPGQIEKSIEILRKHLYRWRVSCDD